MRAPSLTSAGGNLLSELEDLWTCLDELYLRAAPSHGRGQSGAPWCTRLEDLPWHLAAFDSEFVVSAIARGPNVPAHEQRFMASPAELADWNTSRVALHPFGATHDQALARVAATRDALRRVLRDLDETDLDRPVWWPLPLSGGWRTTRFALEACSSHTWNHVVELHLQTRSPVSVWANMAAQTHRALNRYMHLIVSLLDKDWAVRVGRLVASMAFTGPGGGTWTFHIANGECEVEETAPRHADVVVTLSPETFLKTMVLGTQSQVVAVLTGDIRVRGELRKVAAFRRMFPRPSPNHVFQPALSTLGGRGD